MKIKIDVFGLKKWYKQLLDENFYKFLISLGLFGQRARDRQCII